MRKRLTQLRPIRGSWKINGTADAFCRETCGPDMKYSRGMIDVHPVESGYEEPQPLKAVRFVREREGGDASRAEAPLESNPIGGASGALLVYREKFQRVRFTERMMFRLVAGERPLSIYEPCSLFIAPNLVHSCNKRLYIVLAR